MTKKLTIKAKDLTTPIYFPDATRAVIRGLDSNDLKNSGIEGLVVNPYHLSLQPGTKIIKKARGLKEFMGWDGWIVSDSGGFQIFSMIQQDKSLGKVNDNGIIFYRKVNSKKRKYNFTPEKCIQIQFDLGSDIMFSLDHFAHIEATHEELKVSVRRTIDWGKRCKDEYTKQLEQREIEERDQPLLFGIVQGGADQDLAAKCAEGLLEIGFDGFGLGGFLFDEDNKLDLDAIGHVASLTPDDLPRFALGIGYPQGIVDCYKAGYTMFDCVLPTRDARHKRLYVFNEDPDHTNPFKTRDFTDFLYIMESRYAVDPEPISQYCDCHTCQNYSRQYLQHLFKIEDSLAGRLATIHNLRTYSKLIELMRKHG